MLFVITHKHTPDMCQIDNPNAIARLIDESHINNTGVRLINSYIAPPEHTLFLVIEADDYAAVTRYIRPIIKLGNQRITPVLPILDALEIIKP